MQTTKIPQLHVEIKGSGTPVLLVHGFPFTSRMWQPQLSGLAQAGQILAPDLPGFGASPAAEPPFGVDQLAQACLAALDAQGVSSPAVIGGLSMGGYIALAIARLFPERVRGLMLLSTRAGADSDEAKANRDKAIATAQEQGPAPAGEGMFPKLLAPGNYEAQPETATELKTIMAGATTAGVVMALTAMRDRLDSTPLLRQISAPTLVVHGEEDQVIPKSEAEAMAAAIPGSQLHLIAQAGHVPNLEQPEEFNRIVEGFLGGLS
ncbi:MAG: alpha/beta fold hydrolase [Anaerolineales bacterium]|nr:alpha/beta fold hydrolase [Anaerolineales bacterium]